MKVDASGRKYTAEITPDGINWRNKDTKNKIVAELGNDNNVVYRKVSVTENKPVYPCRDCKSLGEPYDSARTISKVRDFYKAKIMIICVSRKYAHLECSRILCNIYNTSRSALSDIKREAKPSVVYLIKHELRVF